MQEERLSFVKEITYAVAKMIAIIKALLVVTVGISYLVKCFEDMIFLLS